VQHYEKITCQVFVYYYCYCRHLGNSVLAKNVNVVWGVCAPHLGTRVRLLWYASCRLLLQSEVTELSCKGNALFVCIVTLLLCYVVWCMLIYITFNRQMKCILLPVLLVSGQGITPNVMVEWLILLLRYSWNPWSKSWPLDQLSWLRSFVFFLSPSRRIPG
jgi:hypothetical protein